MSKLEGALTANSIVQDEVCGGAKSDWDAFLIAIRRSLLVDHWDDLALRSGVRGRIVMIGTVFVFLMAVMAFVLYVRGHIFWIGCLIALRLIALWPVLAALRKADGFHLSVIFSTTSMAILALGFGCFMREPFYSAGTYFFVIGVLSLSNIINLTFKPGVGLALSVVAYLGIIAQVLMVPGGLMSGDPEAPLLLFAVAVATIFHMMSSHLSNVMRDVGVRGIVMVKEELSRIEMATAHARHREELARLNRISLVEATTTSLSHEISQPIAAARNWSAAVTRWLDRVPPDIAEAREAAGEVTVQIDRINGILQSVRRLTERHTADTDRIDIAQSVGATVDLARMGLRRSGVEIDFENRLPAGVTGHLADVDLSHILFNFISNSSDAFAPDAFHKRINVVLGEAGPGQVYLEVTDNAGGIPEDVLPFAADPFFTTKEGGTGLGLGICRAIAERNGGELEIINVSGVGATCRVILSLDAAAEETDRIPASCRLSREASGATPS